MFSNKVPSTRMQRSSEEGAQEKIDERVNAAVTDQDDVEEELGEDIDEVYGRKVQSIDEDRA